MAKRHATEFEKIIHADRQRKESQALAAKIFKRESVSDRRSSAPANGLGTSGGSLAARAGVKKQRASLGGRQAGAGNIDGAWTHDLHNSALGAGSLASRITKPGAAKPPAAKAIAVPNGPKRLQQKQPQRRAASLATALMRDQLKAPMERQANVTNSTDQGISIRGLAGPPVVMAQNFAPGTTAADIESAVTPVGGIVTSCRLLKTNPIIIAEIVFEDPNGAQRVIDTFNNQTADGRLLHVYYKVGGVSSLAPPPATTKVATRSGGANGNANGNVIDGSYGFGDDSGMDVDPHEGGALYSDSLLPNQNNSNGNNSQRAGGGQRGRGRGRGRNAAGR